MAVQVEFEFVVLAVGQDGEVEQRRDAVAAELASGVDLEPALAALHRQRHHFVVGRQVVVDDERDVLGVGVRLDDGDGAAADVGRDAAAVVTQDGGVGGAAVAVLVAAVQRQRLEAVEGRRQRHLVGGRPRTEGRRLPGGLGGHCSVAGPRQRDVEATLAAGQDEGGQQSDVVEAAEGRRQLRRQVAVVGPGGKADGGVGAPAETDVDRASGGVDDGFDAPVVDGQRVAADDGQQGRAGVAVAETELGVRRPAVALERQRDDPGRAAVQVADGVDGQLRLRRRQLEGGVEARRHRRRRRRRSEIRAGAALQLQEDLGALGQENQARDVGGSRRVVLRLDDDGVGQEGRRQRHLGGGRREADADLGVETRVDLFRFGPLQGDVGLDVVLARHPVALERHLLQARHGRLETGVDAGEVGAVLVVGVAAVASAGVVAVVDLGQDLAFGGAVPFDVQRVAAGPGRRQAEARLETARRRVGQRLDGRRDDAVADGDVERQRLAAAVVGRRRVVAGQVEPLQRFHVGGHADVARRPVDLSAGDGHLQRLAELELGLDGRQVQRQAVGRGQSDVVGQQRRDADVQRHVGRGQRHVEGAGDADDGPAVAFDEQRRRLDVEVVGGAQGQLLQGRQRRAQVGLDAGGAGREGGRGAGLVVPSADVDRDGQAARLGTAQVVGQGGDQASVVVAVVVAVAETRQPHGGRDVEARRRKVAGDFRLVASRLAHQQEAGRGESGAGAVVVVVVGDDAHRGQAGPGRGGADVDRLGAEPSVDRETLVAVEGRRQDDGEAGGGRRRRQRAGEPTASAVVVVDDVDGSVEGVETGVQGQLLEAVEGRRQFGFETRGLGLGRQGAVDSDGAAVDAGLGRERLGLAGGDVVLGREQDVVQLGRGRRQFELELSGAGRLDVETAAQLQAVAVLFGHQAERLAAVGAVQLVVQPSEKLLVAAEGRLDADDGRAGVDRHRDGEVARVALLFDAQHGQFRVGAVGGGGGVGDEGAGDGQRAQSGEGRDQRQFGRVVGQRGPSGQVRLFAVLLHVEAAREAGLDVVGGRDDHVLPAVESGARVDVELGALEGELAVELDFQLELVLGQAEGQRQRLDVPLGQRRQRPVAGEGRAQVQRGLAPLDVDGAAEAQLLDALAVLFGEQRHSDAPVALDRVLAGGAELLVAAEGRGGPHQHLAVLDLELHADDVAFVRLAFVDERDDLLGSLQVEEELGGRVLVAGERRLQPGLDAALQSGHGARDGEARRLVVARGRQLQRLLGRHGVVLAGEAQAAHPVERRRHLHGAVDALQRPEGGAAGRLDPVAVAHQRQRRRLVRLDGVVLGVERQRLETGRRRRRRLEPNLAGLAADEEAALDLGLFFVEPQSQVAGAPLRRRGERARHVQPVDSAARRRHRQVERARLGRQRALQLHVDAGVVVGAHHLQRQRFDLGDQIEADVDAGRRPALEGRRQQRGGGALAAPVAPRALEGQAAAVEVDQDAQLAVGVQRRLHADRLVADDGTVPGGRQRRLVGGQHQRRLQAQLGVAALQFDAGAALGRVQQHRGPQRLERRERRAGDGRFRLVRRLVVAAAAVGRGPSFPSDVAFVEGGAGQRRLAVAGGVVAEVERQPRDDGERRRQSRFEQRVGAGVLPVGGELHLSVAVPADRGPGRARRRRRGVQGQGQGQRVRRRGRGDVQRQRRPGGAAPVSRFQADRLGVSGADDEDRVQLVGRVLVLQLERQLVGPRRGQRTAGVRVRAASAVRQAGRGGLVVELDVGLVLQLTGQRRLFRRQPQPTQDGQRRLQDDDVVPVEGVVVLQRVLGGEDVGAVGQLQPVRHLVGRSVDVERHFDVVQRAERRRERRVDAQHLRRLAALRLGVDGQRHRLSVEAGLEIGGQLAVLQPVRQSRPDVQSGRRDSSVQVEPVGRTDSVFHVQGQRLLGRPGQSSDGAFGPQLQRRLHRVGRDAVQPETQPISGKGLRGVESAASAVESGVGQHLDAAGVALVAHRERRRRQHGRVGRDADGGVAVAGVPFGRELGVQLDVQRSFERETRLEAASRLVAAGQRCSNGFVAGEGRVQLERGVELAPLEVIAGQGQRRRDVDVALVVVDGQQQLFARLAAGQVQFQAQVLQVGPGRLEVEAALEDLFGFGSGHGQSESLTFRVPLERQAALQVGLLGVEGGVDGDELVAAEGRLQFAGEAQAVDGQRQLRFQLQAPLGRPLDARAQRFAAQVGRHADRSARIAQDRSAFGALQLAGEAQGAAVIDVPVPEELHLGRETFALVGHLDVQSDAPAGANVEPERPAAQVQFRLAAEDGDVVDGGGDVDVVLQRRRSQVLDAGGQAAPAVPAVEAERLGVRVGPRRGQVQPRVQLGVLEEDAAAVHVERVLRLRNPPSLA